jgi:RHS repeat-associated protein
MLDLVQEYTGHPFDQVLNLYYAKARMYDAQDRRFVAVDKIKGTIENLLTLNLYIYVIDNPLKYIDPLGLEMWFSLKDLEKLYNIKGINITPVYQEYKGWLVYQYSNENKKLM